MCTSSILIFNNPCKIYLVYDTFKLNVWSLNNAELVQQPNHMFQKSKKVEWTIDPLLSEYSTVTLIRLSEAVTAQRLVLY